MTQDGRDGWNLWVRSLISTALDAERRAMAELIGKIIVAERERTSGVLAKATIALELLRAEAVYLRAQIAALKSPALPAAEAGTEIVPIAGTRH